jgi:uncharacterized membrane protein YhiD involved in acid resistance
MGEHSWGLIVAAILGAAATGLGVEFFKAWFARRKERDRERRLTSTRSIELQQHAEDKLWARTESLEATRDELVEKLSEVRIEQEHLRAAQAMERIAVLEGELAQTKSQLSEAIARYEALLLKL